MQTIKKKDVIRYLREYDSSLHLGDVVGKGGTSVVYDLPGTVPPQVLKVMDTRATLEHDSDRPLDVRERQAMWKYFRNEIRTMEELRNCPYIMPLYDSYEYIDPSERGLPENQRRYRSVFLIRMAKLTPLENYLDQHSLNETLLTQMAIHICQALQVCAEHHILHRDVKPNNIFVCQEEGALRFILGDFGICRRLSASDSVVTQCGTKAFIAPEVLYGVNLHGRMNADLYSLGSSLYFLLSGGKFPRQFYENGRLLDPLPHISKQLANIIKNAVEPNPENRYQHVHEMLNDLNQLLDSSASAPRTALSPDENPFLKTKLAMLNGDYDRAQQLAAEGSRSGDKNCMRLAAYLYYRKAAGNAREAEAVLKTLDQLIYEGDSIAQCLSGMIFYDLGRLSECINALSTSAKEGCVIAQYLYGRFLYSGQLGLEANAEAGLETLMGAVKAGYLPAMRFFKRILEQDPHVIYSPDMLRLMELELEDYDDKKRAEIIRFL